MQHCGYGVHAAWKALQLFTTTVIFESDRQRMTTTPLMIPYRYISFVEAARSWKARLAVCWKN